MQNLYGLYGPGANGVRGKGFSTHINNRARFQKTYIQGKYFFIHFNELFFTLDTICADNKDKLVTGCKNQLIKKCLRNL